MTAGEALAERRLVHAILQPWMSISHTGIRHRIPDPPRWFDEHGVPRYGVFSPRMCADIYADEAALVRIECQCCQHAFDVAFTTSASGRMLAALNRFQRTGPKPAEFTESWLAKSIRERTLHYGDPPNIGCCPAGPTMSSNPKGVLEYWARGRGHGRGWDWERDRTLEVELAAPWAQA